MGERLTTDTESPRVLTEEQRFAIAKLCRLHIEDYEDGPQLGVAVDEESIERLREIKAVCES
jgi:hypothetical protein